MPNQYFTITATFQQLLGWIAAYAAAVPPPAGKHLRCAGAPPTPIWPGNGSHWFATVYASSRWQAETPLFEIGAQEAHGCCRVRLRGLDPHSASWHRAMVDWLAPEDAPGEAVRDVYPLPELPAPPVPAAPPSTSPPPARPPAVGETNAPRVPRRPADLRRWKAAWKRIKPLAAAGKSNEYIAGWFLKHDDDIRLSKESIIRIIAAGEAGLLE